MVPNLGTRPLLQSKFYVHSASRSDHILYKIGNGLALTNLTLDIIHSLSSRIPLCPVRFPKQLGQIQDAEILLFLTPAFGTDLFTGTAHAHLDIRVLVFLKFSWKIALKRCIVYENPTIIGFK